MLWIGYGFPGMTLSFSSRVRQPTVVQSQHPTGNSWLCASTSLRSPPITNSPLAIDVFKKVVVPAQAILGAEINIFPPTSGWSNKDINFNDPIEAALAGELQNSALAHVAASTSHVYVGPWNAFVFGVKV